MKERNEQFNKKKIIIVSIFILLLAIVSIVGVSYAAFTNTKTQTISNNVTVGCFNVTFKDKFTQSDNVSSQDINLTNQYAVSDAKGIELMPTPYTFVIENTCDMNSSYQINLEQLASSGSDISSDYLRIQFNNSNYDLASFPTATTQISGIESRKVYEGYLNANDSATFTLRMWVKESATTAQASGKVYNGKVVVVSTATNSVDPTGGDMSDQVPRPELYQGLVPVVYDNAGNTKVASMDNWFDYDNHKWANAVLVTNSSDYVNNDGTLKANASGTTIPTANIKQYYVWIPRYKYKLFNAGVETSAPEQMIEIKFQSKDDTKATGTQNGEWLTHPAFTFGSTELSGIWVGKFETSHTTLSGHTSGNELACSNENCANAAGIEILPNKVSIVNDTVANQFYASRSIENNSSLGLNANQIDTHMMKNTEWGAVAYLSSSKYGLYVNSNTCHNSDNNKTVSINGQNVNRCEVWINNTHTGTGCGVNNKWGIAACGGTITGCSAKNSISDNPQDSMSTCGGEAYNWNGSTNNGRSSTTGTIYGIYDMSGGTWEYVMGNQSSSTDSYVYFPKNSGLTTAPNDKYFDKYLASTGADDTAQRMDHKRGILGDAIRETMKAYGTSHGGWFSDYSYFVSTNYPWFLRGGYASYVANAGVFGFDRDTGGVGSRSFRIVLTAE